MTVQEIDGELFVDSGYGLKQVADLVGNLAYLYDGGVVQLTEEEMHELEHDEAGFPIDTEDEEEFVAGVFANEAVAPLLIYREFTKDMKGLDASQEEFWRVWLEYAKDNGLDNYDAMKVVDTFASTLVRDHIWNKQHPSGRSMEFIMNYTGVDNLVSLITPYHLEGINVDELQEKLLEIERYIDFIESSADVKTDQTESRNQINRLKSLFPIIEDAIYNQTIKDEQNPFSPDTKQGRTYPIFMGGYNLLESFAAESVWRCSLCNMELEETDDVEQRKKRHDDFHKDESIEKGGRQRNWTFGEVDWTLQEPSTKTSLYENYIEEVAEELYWDLTDGVVSWEDITNEMRADVKKYVVDNLRMPFTSWKKLLPIKGSTNATEGGWGSGRKDHQQWMNPTERFDDQVESEDMYRNKFLPFQIEESTNPYLEEYNKAFELEKWDEEDKEKMKGIDPETGYPTDFKSWWEGDEDPEKYDYGTMENIQHLLEMEHEIDWLGTASIPSLDWDSNKDIGADWQKGGESW